MKQHAIVWIAGEATLRSIWKIPARDDVGLLDWSGDRLEFKGRATDAELPVPTSARLVRARPRWGPLSLMALALVLSSSVVAGIGGVLPWSIGPVAAGGLAGGFAGWYVSRWVRLDFDDHPPVFVIRYDGFWGGSRGTPEMMEALRSRFALG